MTDEEVLESLANNVQQRLDALGWSGNKLAQEAHENQPTISRLLNKKNLVSVGSLTRIASALGTTVDWLLDPRNCRQHVGT